MGTDDDDWREEILKGSLDQVEQALDDGIPVQGVLPLDRGRQLRVDSTATTCSFGLFDRDRNPRAERVVVPRSLTLRRGSVRPGRGTARERRRLPC